jgi:hypothetical protein
MDKLFFRNVGLDKEQRAKEHQETLDSLDNIGRHIDHLQSLVDRFIEVYGNQQHCTAHPCNCEFCKLNRDMALAATEGTKFKNQHYTI